MTYNRRVLLLGTIAFLTATGVMLPVRTASADLIVELGSVLNGAAPSETGLPWLTAEFRAASQPGMVTLTLRSHLDNPSQFITQLAFNVAPAIDPASITITQTSGSPVEKITAGKQDAQEIHGTGNLGRGFDFLLNWPSSSERRFGGTDVATFALNASNLTPEDFNYSNASQNADFAAKVQGIPGNTSGVIKDSETLHIQPVPEPATLVLLGTVGMLLAIVGLLRFIKR